MSILWYGSGNHLIEEAGMPKITILIAIALVFFTVPNSFAVEPEFLEVTEVELIKVTEPEFMEVTEFEFIEATDGRDEIDEKQKAIDDLIIIIGENVENKKIALDEIGKLITEIKPKD